MIKLDGMKDCERDKRTRWLRRLESHGKGMWYQMPNTRNGNRKKRKGGLTNNSSPLLESRQDQIENGSTDILKAHINVAKRFEVFDKEGILVVESEIDAQLFDEVFTLFVGSGNGDDTATLELGNLAGDRTNSSGGSSDDLRG